MRNKCEYSLKCVHVWAHQWEWMSVCLIHRHDISVYLPSCTKQPCKMSYFSSKFHFPFFHSFGSSSLGLLRVRTTLLIAFSTVFRLSDIMINDFITWVKQEPEQQKAKQTQQTENRIIIILFMHAFCLSVVACVGKAASKNFVATHRTARQQHEFSASMETEISFARRQHCAFFPSHQAKINWHRRKCRKRTRSVCHLAVQQPPAARDEAWNNIR